MASTQSQMLVGVYRDWSARLGAGTMTIPEIREMFEGWGTLATEPSGMEYEELSLGGVRCLGGIESSLTDRTRVLLCFHGGGFVAGSVMTHRKMFSQIAKAVGARAVIVDYDLTPANAHPGVLRQCLAVYTALLQSGYRPEHIATIGDSAGGNLAVSSILYARGAGHPLPAAAVSLSPWFDMEPSGATMVTNASVDVFVSPDAVHFMSGLYLAGQDPKDPLASPLYADLNGLPPVLIQVGGYETLLDDSVRFTERARAAGTEVTLRIFPEMQHVFQLMAGNAPEADLAIGEIALWLREKMVLA